MSRTFSYSILILLAACAEFSAEAPQPAPPTDAPSQDEQPMEEGRFGAGERAGGSPGGGIGAARPAAPASTATGRMRQEAQNAKGEGKDKRDKDGDDGTEGQSAPLRSWFPESFLWKPLIETDASGKAVVPIQVPDTLTTWRVLALGLSQEGAQGGALTSFASTLPAYVDVRLPALLHSGDIFSLPVQVVNQTSQELSRALNVLVRGGEGAGGGQLRVAPYGSGTERVRVAVSRAGLLTVEAGLEGLDRVLKTVPVLPTGRPVEQLRGGTLGAPREFSLDIPPDASDTSLDVLVFPGALSVLTAELNQAGGGSAWEEAYLWSLAGSAEPLVASGEFSKEVLREKKLRSLQRLRKHTRSTAVPPAVAALSALAESPKDSLEGKLAARLSAQLGDAQAPDGLWPGASTALDDILVSTAQAVWALGPSDRAHRLKAQGAFERYRDRLNNPYVAAWALVAGAVEPQRVEVLTKLVKDSIKTAPDGSKYLPATGYRADGSSASTTEATALAALLFKGEPELSSELITWLLSHRSPYSGFGDGLSSMMALKAIHAVLGSDIPKEASIKLYVDGVEVAAGILDTRHPYSPIRLQAPLSSGSHSIKIASETPIPGLAFALSQRSYLPWQQEEPKGLDLRVELPENLKVGVAAPMKVTAAGPSGSELDVKIGLAPGTTVDPDALDALVSSGLISSYRTQEGALLLSQLKATGGKATVELPITPGFAGKLTAEASSVWRSTASNISFYRVPEVWEIEG
jgi:hypothetical protein